MTTISFRPDGVVRAIWSQRFPFEQAFGSEFLAARRRASVVLTVPVGPHAGDFFADFSYLAELTGDARHHVCLVKTFRCEAALIEAEVAWLRANWLSQ